MRISKLSPLAVAMAGALALAGCGGSDDMTNGGTPPGGGTPPAGGAKTLEVPNGLNLGNTVSTVEQSYIVRTGDTVRYTDGEGAPVFLTCSGNADCVIRVPAGAELDGRTMVSYTGGTLSASKTDPRSTARAGNVPQPTAAADPLSAETIAEAFKATNRKATVWAPAGSASPLTSGHHEVTLVSGETIELDLGGTAALHWGNWIKYTAPATDVGKRTGESVGQFFGGTKPRYGMKPDDGIDEATYELATGVELQFKDGPKDWKRGPSPAHLDLIADFNAGKVGGEIRGVTARTATGFPDVITLKETDITAAGTFDGAAEFKGSTVMRKSGAWDGAFFGSTTAVSDDDVEEYVAPSDVAGTFEVAGRHGTGTAAKDLHVRGGFGSGCSNGC